jgi:DNA-binding LacI/PurR family transcriptional regulator
LLRPDRPTAVFAGYDGIAFLVIEIAEQLGLEVGQDLSVVGINGHPRAE